MSIFLSFQVRQHFPESDQSGGENGWKISMVSKIIGISLFSIDSITVSCTSSGNIMKPGSEGYETERLVLGH